MKCYYEELGVLRSASDAEIKTAYRRLALKWHPDKNPDRLEEAKEHFQLIQQAYEVLSDCQERAWYDNHREQILRGKNSDYEENCLDVFQYFTSSCYKGYGDDDKGFYNVYGEVFRKIAAEDAEFLKDEEDLLKIPQFGSSTSNYEEVVGPFYAYWQSYCTKKTYTWLCPYDIQEIKDRRILREIEKDMKKIVQKAKRERNEEVRNLISFIRKRDKRVQVYKKLLEDRAAINRQKQEQNRIEQIRKRNREVKEMQNSNTFNEGYEEQLKQLEQEYADDSCSNEDSEENESEPLNEMTEDLNLNGYVEDLYCVACNRLFKNSNTFGNHETSKKHRENIERLKQEILEDEKSLNEENEKCNLQNLSEESGEGKEKISTDIESEPEIQQKKSKKSKKLKSKTEKILGDEESLYEEENEKGHLENLSEKSGEEKEKLPTDIESEPGIRQKKSKRSKKLKKSKTGNLQTEPDDVKADIDVANFKNSESEEWSAVGKKIHNKNKNKRNKKEVEQNIPEETVEEQIVASAACASLNSEVTSHTCVTCNSNFESKNKLFAHLKKTNHGVYIPKEKGEAISLVEKNKLKPKSKGKRK